MKTPEDEIKKKLAELELSVEEEQGTKLAKIESAAHLAKVESTQAPPGASLADDMNVLFGFMLLLTGILMVFNHVKVGTGMLAMLGVGQAGFGLIIIPLLIGCGLIFYNYKMKAGWIVLAASLAVIFFSVLSQLIMTFPATSLLGLIIMFLPLAAGCALVMKGIMARRPN